MCFDEVINHETRIYGYVLKNIRHAFHSMTYDKRVYRVKSKPPATGGFDFINKIYYAPLLRRSQSLMVFIFVRRSRCRDLHTKGVFRFIPHFSRYASALRLWEARCFLVSILNELPHSRQTIDCSLMDLPTGTWGCVSSGACAPRHTARILAERF